MKYRQKNVIVDAVQWFKHGDHASVMTYLDNYYECENCNNVWEMHGWIRTVDNSCIVCPGDWIVTFYNGQHEVYLPSAFEAAYERVEE